MSIRTDILQPLLDDVGIEGFTLDGPIQAGHDWLWTLRYDGEDVYLPARFTPGGQNRSSRVTWQQVAGFLYALVWVGPETIADILREEG